jgi:uncharacterized membrane protein YqhA
MSKKPGKMIQAIAGTRYLVIIPIIGLALTAAALFIVSGLRMILFFVERLSAILQPGHFEEVESMVTIELIEFVHQFLIGTVLFITAIGLYQLFIHELPLPSWITVESTEELETNLISVTVVVLAINFLGIVFAGPGVNILNHGAGIALPIAALALFIGVRSRTRPDLPGQASVDGQEDPNV